IRWRWLCTVAKISSCCSQSRLKTFRAYPSVLTACRFPTSVKSQATQAVSACAKRITNGICRRRAFSTLRNEIWQAQLETLSPDDDQASELGLDLRLLGTRLTR